MSATIAFNAAVQKLRSFRAWKSLIGKEYFGGTRGKGGEYGAVTNATFTCEIYWQQYDGSTNYHPPDKEYQEILNQAALQHASAILATAEALLVQKQMAAAAAAKEEALSVLATVERGAAS